MSTTISLVVSVLALALSSLTAWLTLLRRGKVVMTQPTVIYFGPDGGPPSDNPLLKVFLRTLLYSTSKRGRIIESMYVRLSRGETSQNFNIWAYGDKQLYRGSGLFVPENGIAANHHFLLPADGTAYSFLPGQYTLEVFASIIGKPTTRLLSTHLELGKEEAGALAQGDRGVYFDWGPDAKKYHSHIDSKRKPELTDMLRDYIS